MSEKHAYLIMAHHRMDLLQRLVNALDDERNDLYIHLDKKYKGNEVISAQFSKIIWIKRTDVRWGGYSQIRCELDLLKAALNSDVSYQYYHLLTGASYPIKPKEYIFDFFNQNDGFQFVGFSRNGEKCYERVKNRFLFNELGKPKKRLSYKIKLYIRHKVKKVQNILGIDNFKKYHLVFKKGLAYWSIKEDFAKYVLKNEKLIHSMLKKSFCGDEVFIQTLLFNSPFKDKIYNLDNETLGCMICSGWIPPKREGQNFILEDFELLKNTAGLYALKFEGKDGLLLLDRIDREILYPTVNA